MEDLLSEVQEELREINSATQLSTPVRPELISQDGYRFDKQGQIFVGPKVSQHLLDVIYRTMTRHLGTKKMLS